MMNGRVYEYMIVYQYANLHELRNKVVLYQPHVKCTVALKGKNI